MNHLKFRRQFLLSQVACEVLADWEERKIASFFLYVHPDCGLTTVRGKTSEITLIGFVLDPNRPNETEERIVEDFLNADSKEKVAQLLYPLVGRFVLIINRNGKLNFYHDACGLKTLYYIFKKNGFYAASQPNLLKLVTELTKSERYNTYFESAYVQDNTEHYFPCGRTLYENVHQLVPNHYLDETERQQKRFWPSKRLSPVDYDTAKTKFCSLLKNTMYAANKRFHLALPITAGLDSRILLSACKEIKDQIKFYTLQYQAMTESSADIRIPGKILSALGLPHQVIDCRNIDADEFMKIYLGNTDMAHYDWGKIALGIYDKYDQTDMAVKGNCVEIGRCAYYKDGNYPKNLTIENLLKTQYRWDGVDFIVERLDEWLQEMKKENMNFGYKVLDLFYWEHRMGSWQSQSQLEWDIVQNVFTPFNNRELVDLMLQTDQTYRIKPDSLLFMETIKILWPEILDYAINPLPFSARLRKLAKIAVQKLGLYKFLRKIVKGNKQM